VTAAARPLGSNSTSKFSPSPLWQGHVEPIRPCADEPRRSVMGELYDLLDAFRDYGSNRVQRCTHRQVAAAVRISEAPGAFPHYVGLQSCGDVWACPPCAARINLKRLDEVQRALAAHSARYGHGSIALASLTVRHGFGDDCQPLRRGVARAWSKLLAGKGWETRRRQLGIEWIRKLEVTQGANGWHPHLHVVLLCTRELPADFGAWLSERWQRCVERALGADFVPDDEHGVDLQVCHGERELARYLVKLGLELLSPTSKRGRSANRTPLQILADFAHSGDLLDLRLYRRYATAMKGARQLTWSKGLKARYAINDLTNEEMLEAEDRNAKTIHHALISAREWVVVRDIPGAKATLLEIAKDGGRECVYAAIDLYRGVQERPDSPLPEYHRLLIASEMQLATVHWYCPGKARLL
jgi:hypothetical protein